MTSIGTATVQIIPSLDGVSAAVQKQLGVLPDLGKNAGKLLGDSLAAGVDSASKKVEAATGKIAAANKKVEDSAGKVRVAEAQLQALRDKGITDAGRLAAAEEKVAAAHRNNDQASAAAKSAADTLAAAEGKLADASKRAADAQSQQGKAAGDAAGKQGLLGKAAGAAGSAFDSLAGKAKSAGSAILTGIGFGAGANIAGITKSLVDMGDTFANVNKTLAFSTGATGKGLDALNASVRTIGKDSPKALTDIATSMADVARATQLTGQPLEDITKRMIKLDSLGQGADIGGLTQAMRAFGVPAEKMAAQMDDLFKVSRSTGIGMDQLAQTVGKGAPQLKQFGLGIGDSAALLGGLQKAGIDGDKAMVGLNTALKVVSKQGGDVKANFSNAVAEIKRMSDAGNQAGANAAASKLFGGKAFGPMLDAIKQGRLDINALDKSIAGQGDGILKAGGAVTSMAGAWQMMKNNVLILLEPIVTKIFGSIQKGILWFRAEGAEGIRKFGDKIKEIWNSDGVQTFIASVKGIVENAIWPNIMAKITLVVGAFKEIAAVVGPILVAAFQAFGSAVVSVAGFLADHTTALKVIGTTITVILIPSMITAGVGYATLGAKAVASGVKQVGTWVSTQIASVKSSAIQLANSYKVVGGWIAMGATATKNAAIMVAGWIAAGAGAVGTTVKTVAYGVAMAVIKTATMAWTGAQWLLNVALNANPISLIVIAIAAFVAGIVLAYKNSETFRNIVAAAWKWIKEAALSVVSWFTDTALPFLGKVWEGIKAGLGALADGAVAAWDLFTAPARAVVSWFTDTLVPFLGKTWEDIKAGFKIIVTVAQEVWDGVVQKFTGMIDFVGSIPAKVADKAKGMWDGISNAFKTMVNGLIRLWNSLASALSFTMPDIVGMPRRGEKISPIPTINEFAEGGWTGPGSKMQPAGIVHADEFVLSKRARTAIEASNPGLLDQMNRSGKVPGYDEGGRVAYRLPAGTNTGGYGNGGKVFPEWVHALGAKYGVKPSTYAGHQEDSGLNKGIDWVGSVEAMQKFAEAMRSVPGIEQVIWRNPSTKQTIGVLNGKPVGPGTDQPGYYRDDWKDHENHVHIRTSWSIPADTTASPTSPVAAAAATVETGAGGAMTQEEYDRQLAALKTKYGISGGSTELADRATDIAKRKRDLAAKYRADKAAATGDKAKLKQLATEYTAASNALKTESDKIADDRDSASARKPEDKTAYEAAKKDLDAKFKAGKKADDKADGKAGDSGGSKGSYPTTISGWAGFIGEHFVGGQIKSLLSVFGIPDAPSWMGAASSLIGGIKVTDKAGKSVFDGSNPLAALTGAVDGKPAEKTTTPKTADVPVMPGGALPLTGQQVETLTSTLSAPPAEYKGGSQAIYDAVYKQFREAGFDGSQWSNYVQMVNRESAWDPEARNPKSDAYGLAQFLGKGNVDKYLGGSNRNVPVDVQAKGMMQYIKDRYGDPSKAWEFWQKNNWYAEGGWTGPGGKHDPAGIVHADEFVMSKRARTAIEASNPGLLDRMNATGRVPGYDLGGLVGGAGPEWTDIARRGLDVAMSTIKGQTGKSVPTGPAVNYTINARDTEDAFIRAQRQERERAAAKLSRF